MKFKILFALSFVGFSFCAQAALLNTQRGVELVAINGQKISNFGKSASKKIELSEGQYQIVARYENTLRQGSKRVLFTSKPYVFDLRVGKDDLSLSVPLLRNESQAKAFFHDPKWQLKIGEKEQIISGKILKGNGFASYSDIEKAIAFHNSTSNAVKSVQVASPLVENDQNNTKVTSLSQLKHWYAIASKDEKFAFKQWMLEQDF